MGLLWHPRAPHALLRNCFFLQVAGPFAGFALHGGRPPSAPSPTPNSTQGGQSADTPIITFPLRTLQVNTPSASSPKDDPPISRPASEAGLPDVAGSKGASEAGTAPDVDVEAGCALVDSPKKELFKVGEWAVRIGLAGGG